MDTVRNVSFTDYIQNKGIKLSKSFPSVDKKNISAKKITEQINIIAEFHSVVKNYNGLDAKTIKNKTGKLIGRYKIQVKNLKKYAAIKEKSSSLNTFEKYFLNTYKDVVKRCEQCLEYINDDEYFNIIKRSMKDSEICLGNCYFDNIWKEKSIFIRDYSDISFNMVEIDGISFINKLKCSNCNLNFKDIIDEYIYAEDISSASKNFMMALISYPNEYIKCIERYRRNGSYETEERFAKRLAKAIKKDGESII
ncbi:MULTISPECIES: spore coat protein [Clostridium]|uniref:spore coat protein n=1 Tax=Clostridium TaxID=1485 RepID=UPI000824DD22|nr:MULTISPECIES: spore coat protein [Clostridium]PJI09115.1 spore coat protein [Clostridium sp. CT7]